MINWKSLQKVFFIHVLDDVNFFISSLTMVPGLVFWFLAGLGNIEGSETRPRKHPKELALDPPLA